MLDTLNSLIPMRLIIRMNNTRVLEFTVEDWDLVPDDTIEIILNPNQLPAKDLANTLEYHSVEVIDFGIHENSCNMEFVRLNRAHTRYIRHEVQENILTIQY